MKKIKSFCYRAIYFLLGVYGLYDAWTIYSSGNSPVWENLGSDGGTIAIVIDIALSIVLFVLAFSSKARKKVNEKQIDKESKEKEVKKVWTGTYLGTDPRAPKILSVPSSRMFDRPSYDEIEDALVALGMDRDTARVVKGASISDWDFK